MSSALVPTRALLLAALLLLSLGAAACVSSNIKPVGKASADATLVFSGAPVSFTANGSKDRDGKIRTYSWEFGDGATSTGKEVSHTYTRAGAFAASLVVIDDKKGKSEAVTVGVNVLGTPVATPPFAPTGVAISLALDPAAANVTLPGVQWDFGDGSNGSGVNVSHPFAQDGAYTVRATVSTIPPISATTTVTIANRAPSAVITAPSPPVVTNRALVFSAATSSDPDGDVVDYGWEFGDHSLAGSGQEVSHTYTSPGTYHVLVTITDDDGAPANASLDVLVVADLVFEDLDDNGDVIGVSLWVDSNGNLTRANLTVELRNLGDLKVQNTINVSVASYTQLGNPQIDHSTKSWAAQVDEGVAVTVKVGGVLTNQGDSAAVAATLFVVTLSYQDTVLAQRLVKNTAGAWGSTPYDG